MANPKGDARETRQAPKPVQILLLPSANEVIMFTGGGVHPIRQTPPRQTHTPWADTPPAEQTPSWADTHTPRQTPPSQRRYASY